MYITQQILWGINGFVPACTVNNPRAVQDEVHSLDCNKGGTFRAEFERYAGKRHRTRAEPKKTYRNPVALALEWRKAVDAGQYSSRGDLARKKGVSRARDTQVLNLLRLAPGVIGIVTYLGDLLPAPMVTEKQLRQITNLPSHSQLKELAIILDRMRSSEELTRRS